MAFNGWTNYETWNVALWLSNDEGLYLLMCGCPDYASLRERLRERGIVETPDHVAYGDSGLDIAELDDLVRESGAAHAEPDRDDEDATE